MSRINEENRWAQFIDLVTIEEGWGLIGRRAKELLPTLTGDTTLAGIDLSLFHDVVAAANRAGTSLPLARSSYHESLSFNLRSISYYPNVENELLYETIIERMEQLGITDSYVAAQSGMYEDPRKFSSLRFHVTDGRVDVSRRRPLTATLNVKAATITDQLLLTAAILPSGVFKEDAHKIMYAQNLRPAANDEFWLPKNLEEISLYTTDHHGSTWSLHCNGYADSPVGK